MKPVHEGALTNLTVNAMKKICDKVISEESDLFDRKDKVSGSLYMRINKKTKQKFQVIRSTGKHKNAILCCLGWFQQHTFAEQRKQSMSELEISAFLVPLVALQ